MRITWRTTTIGEVHKDFTDETEAVRFTQALTTLGFVHAVEGVD